MEPQISEDSQIMERQLGDPEHLLQIPAGSKPLIYTTNIIEGFNRQLSKVTKSKSVFPTDDSLLKMLYLAMMGITKKWTGRRKDWGMIHSQMDIYFPSRIS